MTINELQDNVIEEFSVFDDWMDEICVINRSRETPFPRSMRNINGKQLDRGLPKPGLVPSGLCRWKDYFPRRKRRRDRQKVSYTPFDQYPIRPYPAGDTGCRSLLYRQGRIKRAFIPYSFQRVGSDGEAKCVCTQWLTGQRNNNKNRCFHTYIGTSRYVYTCKPTPI
mgnify:CR=1 FL=1